MMNSVPITMVRILGAALTLMLSFSTQASSSESPTPLSFYKIAPDQKIAFQASGWSSQGLMIFHVEVCSAPGSLAMIWLQMNPAMSLDGAQRAWRHHIDERVEKMLSESDIKYLEAYLDEYRSLGRQDSMTITSTGWQEFRLIQKEANGTQKLLRREDYKL